MSLDDLDCLDIELSMLDSTEDVGLEFEVCKEAHERAALLLFKAIRGSEELERLYIICRDPDEHENLNTELLKSLKLPVPKAAAWDLGKRHAFLETALRKMRARREQLRSKKLQAIALDKAVERFSTQLSLNRAETALLEFVTLMHGISWFRSALAMVLGASGNRRGIEQAAHLLGFKPHQIAQAISSRSNLVRAGLVTWDPSSTDRLPSKLTCPSRLPRALLIDGAGPHEFLTQQCQLAPQTSLSLEDFSYLDREIRLIIRLVLEASRKRTVGVNLLLYGEPGTGKTELARLLAAATGMELWEVGCRDDDEGDVSSRERLGYLRFGQTVLSKGTKPLLLFDEAEDVFEYNMIPWLGINPGQKGHGKAWINQLLENNPVPTLWLSNRTEGIDSAHLRRFLYVLEVPRPPRSARRNILARELGPAGVPSDWLEQISADERLVPGHIARARRLLDHLGGKLDPEEAKEAAEQGLVHTLRATGQGRHLKGQARSLTRYRPEFLNADTDLGALTDGVTKVGAGRLCFYGPPGTGKSAFARHLADKAGKPLIYRRASDLMSMWVGGTEKNIAQMFEEAEREGGAILLDEADGFLASRQGATKSWEITQVNEMLTQMESFDGLFMASTNLVDRLDFASLRRFDQKIHFGYMTPEQIRHMFLQVLSEHQIKLTKSDQTKLEHLCSLSNVTPGDFAAIIRKARINLASISVSWWLQSLSCECAFKPDRKNGPLGFI